MAEGSADGGPDVDHLGGRRGPRRRRRPGARTTSASPTPLFPVALSDALPVEATEELLDAEILTEILTLETGR